MEPKKLRDLSNETIQTERLSLVGLSVEYAEQMYSELTEEVTKYMSIYPPTSVEAEVEYINSSLEKVRNGTNLLLIILDKTTGEFLGCVGLHKIDTREPDVGIWVKKGAHGRKIGREAVLAVKKWADQNLDYNYLVYRADEHNIPSQKIAEFLGGQIVFKGKVTGPFGKELDEVKYHIPKSK